MDERFALDGYVVDELIGFGGTGEVWRAHEVATGETVALKRLRTRSAASTERLRREAGLLATVAGPHVIGVRRLHVEADEAVLVMDHAPGGSLATVLGVRGRLPAPEVVTVLAPIAAALAAAHARDLIHGDITPANILFTADGRPLLADFGVARAVGATSVPGAEQHVIEGTLDYLDPVVAAGGAVGPASDVFALGAVGFAALTGHSLWGSGPVAEVLARASSGDRDSVMTLAPATPPALAAVVESMLCLAPDDRPDARSVATAVLRACPAAPVGLVHALPPVAPPMTSRVSRAEPSEPAPPAPPAARRSVAGRSTDRAARVARPWRRRALTVAVAAAALVGAVGLGIGLAHAGRGQAHALVPPLAPPLVPPTPTQTPTPTPATPTQTTPRFDGDTPSGDGVSPSNRGDLGLVSWRSVVTRLETLRTKAFATADVAPLALVYAPRATAYSADLTTVRSLASRGLHARGFAATVDRVTVETATATSARLRVVDRLAGYTLVDATGKIAGQGAARPARAFTMTLTRIADIWKVAAITPA